jgi:formylglycine-generating enzyme required for sulfatase activity
LAAFEPDAASWPVVADRVSNALIKEGPLETDQWAELLRGVAPWLQDALVARFADSSATSSERETAARALARYADGRLLAQLILQADAAQFQLLFPAVEHHRSDVAPRMRMALKGAAEADDPAKHRAAQRVRNAALALLRLDEAAEVWPLFGAAPDPTVRTLLILQIRDFGVPVARLLDALADQTDPVVRQALLLAIEPYKGPDLTGNVGQCIVERSTEILHSGPYQTERSAALWLLRSWGRMEAAPTISPAMGPRNDRDWWLTPEGHTMLRISGPLEFDMGSPSDEPGHEPYEFRHRRRIEHSFAISTCEVTIGQYRRFRQQSSGAADVSSSEDCPINHVSWLDAVAYCRWLSEQEQVPEQEMCYPPLPEIKPGFKPADDFVRRTGYRLPTEAEWEYACRAGSTTRWFTGTSEESLQKFAWLSANSGEHLWPVGTLRPNPLGLFDICGNVAEWCHNVEEPDLPEGGQPKAGYRPAPQASCASRGGAYHVLSKRSRSAQRYFYEPSKKFSFTGFRLARTLRSNLPR